MPKSGRGDVEFDGEASKETSDSNEGGELIDGGPRWGREGGLSSALGPSDMLHCF